jgi:hypothetical protein
MDDTRGGDDSFAEVARSEFATAFRSGNEAALSAGLFHEHERDARLCASCNCEMTDIDPFLL